MRRLFPLLVVVVVVATGCGSTAAGSRGGAAAASASEPLGAEPLSVVATTYPLAWLAQRIAPHAHVHGLTSQASDPHDLELSPDDRGAIEQADLVAYVGDIGFQPQVEEAIAASPAVALPLTLAAQELLTREDGGPADGGEQVGEGGDPAADDPGRDAREHGAVDAHLWLSPAIMADYAGLLADELAELDRASAHVYRRNADQVADELAALSDELDAILSDCAFEQAIVSHAAYAYLLQPRRLEQQGISGGAGHAEASPQRLAELTAVIRELGISAVLSEPVEGREDAEALAAEAGVDLLEINPLGSSLTEQQMARGYPVLLREQAETFAKALDCDGSA